MELIPEETRKNIGVTVGGIGFTTWTLLGTLLMVATLIKPVFHAHLWPLVVIILCMMGFNSIGNIRIKLALSGLALALGLWILLNSINGWVVPPSVDLMAELPNIMAGDLSALSGALGPMLGGLAAGGAFVATFGAFMGFGAALMRIIRG